MDNLSLGNSSYVLFFSYTWNADIVVPAKVKDMS